MHFFFAYNFHKYKYFIIFTKNVLIQVGNVCQIWIWRTQYISSNNILPNEKYQNKYTLKCIIYLLFLLPNFKIVL